MAEQAINPYQAPATDPRLMVSSGDPIRDLSFDELALLHKRSGNVSAVAGFILCMLILIVCMTIIESGHDAASTAMSGGKIALVAFLAATFVGFTWRTAWGRVLGIIFCIPTIVLFPIGTLIGILGLRPLLRAPQLFGADRLTHRELTAALNEAKDSRKAARKQVCLERKR